MTLVSRDGVSPTFLTEAPARASTADMRALRFERSGDPSVLHVADVPDPVASPGTVVVAVRAASINPSDVGNVAGRFPQTTLPRTPGRDYSGVVIDGPAEWKNAEVWGTGGDVGFTRDGTHAERIAVPVASLRRKPARLSHEQAASIGVTFMAAWCGIVEYAALQTGETLVVTGAGGGVGGAGAQIGKRIGAHVIGIDRAAPHPDAPVRRAADVIITPPQGEAAKAVREATGGRGADVVLDAVGGPMFAQSLAILAPRGRLAIISSAGQRQVSFDLVDFYHNETQMFGVDTLKRDLVASARMLEAITPGFEDGSFLPPVIERVVSLTDAADAYRRVAEGARGRVVLDPTRS